MVKEQLPNAQLTSLTNMGEAVNELQSGKVDAVHMDEPVALSYAGKKSELPFLIATAFASPSFMVKLTVATATAQENNDGLTPSRPLTSGELFQGMSRAIPTGRVVLLPLTNLKCRKGTETRHRTEVFPVALRQSVES